MLVIELSFLPLVALDREIHFGKRFSLADVSLNRAKTRATSGGNSGARATAHAPNRPCIRANHTVSL